VTSRRAKQLGVVVALALNFTCGWLFAAAPRVLLVYPAEAEPSVSAALVRVRGELTADGFDVLLVKAQLGTSSAAAMGEAEHDSGSATVGLFLNADGKSAELWVVDKLTDKTVVRRVNTASEPTDQLSEVLAVRAVELLRASLLEFLVVQRQPESHSPAPQQASLPNRATIQHVSEWAARPMVGEPAIPWTVEAGLGLLLNPGQVNPTLGLIGRVRFPISQMLQPRLSFAGLGTRPLVAGEGGTARLQQWHALGEAVLMPWPSRRITPLFTLGLGVEHVDVDGEASWPYRGYHSSAWTFVTDAGVGVALKLSSRMALVTEGHTAFTWPYPMLRFSGEDSAKIGRPTLVASLALGVAL
jgi:hypothetical protein